MGTSYKLAPAWDFIISFKMPLNEDLKDLKPFETCFFQIFSVIRVGNID